MMPNVTNFHPRRNEASWQEEVKSYLKNFECEFSFQKVDGSIRNITCTLQESVIPETKGKRPGDTSGIFTVFDTEANGWRSIKIDKIIDFKVQNQYVRSQN